MSSNIATFRETLHADLKPLLPTDWRVVPTIEAAATSLVPVLYTEFTRIESTINGAALPRGTTACSVDLIITDPKTADGAEDAVDEHVLALVSALDDLADLYWSTAVKERLDSGPLAWRVSLVRLAHNTPST